MAVTPEMEARIKEAMLRAEQRKANAKPMTPEQAAQWTIRPDRLPTQAEMDRAEKAVLKE